MSMLTWENGSRQGGQEELPRERDTGARMQRMNEVNQIKRGA